MIKYDIINRQNVNIDFGNTVEIPNQNVDSRVNIGDPVYLGYDIWYIPDEYNTPVGVYKGGNIVVIKGVASGLSGLLSGFHYYMDNEGHLTTDITDYYIGYAISETKLYVDMHFDHHDTKSVYDRAILMGGQSPDGVLGYSQVRYISMPGDFQQFANLFYPRKSSVVLTNGMHSRVVSAEGMTYNIEYANMAIPMDGVNFGQAPYDASSYGISGGSNGTNSKGIVAGRAVKALPWYKDMFSLNITIPNSAQHFGYLYTIRFYQMSVSNGLNDRLVTAGGFYTAWKYTSSMEFTSISIDTAYSTLFGDLTIAYGYGTGFSNDINNRGIFTAFPNRSDMLYINISIQGNASNFGNMNPGGYAGSTSNGINNTGLIMGGYSSSDSTYLSEVDSINMSTSSDAVFFGNLTTGVTTIFGNGASNAAQ